ncbi:MAG TPA: nickel-dependent lactate racemase [Thermodesulfobacteriota bacterium]|nr:nickel-dependent lactate racemase [Thermodesulfobacteriota bacterium]
MKTIIIPYGQEEIPLQIPEGNLGEMLMPREIRHREMNAVLQEALREPIASPPLSEFLTGCRSLLIVVNDASRPTPTGAILEALWPEIGSLPFKILVATGTHAPNSEEGCRRIFGKLWPEISNRVLFHDCRQERGMIFLGETSRGTKVLINQEVMMADRLLVIGSIEPHYFAGYTGGRKAILPGVAAYSSIVDNHSLAMESGSLPLRLSGNPVHEDSEEALRLMTVPPVFSVMMVLTPDHQPYAAFAGSIQETLILGAEKADKVFSVPFCFESDILISVARPPLDMDLYQSQKPIEHGKMALKEDGILILVMPCSQGVGSKEFQELMLQTGDPAKAKALLYQPYRLGHHRITRNLKFLEKGGKIWGITDLSPLFLVQTYIKPRPSLQKAVDAALEEKGPGAKINILFNASLCVPKKI